MPHASRNLRREATQTSPANPRGVPQPSWVRPYSGIVMIGVPQRFGKTGLILDEMPGNG
jgi:hypothetical protein